MGLIKQVKFKDMQKREDIDNNNNLYISHKNLS